MPPDLEIPIATQPDGRRFARRLALFYGTVFGLAGTHLPFFPVWLKAIGLDAAWIGLIVAVPAVTRFTTLPFVTGLAERRGSLRSAMIATTCLTAIGFAVMGFTQAAAAVFAAYALTACLWTPTVPLTDGYALKGIAHFGLDYGPLRLWGSAAFVAGALVCGWLVDVITARHLIWVIVAVAALGAVASFGLQPLDAVAVNPARRPRATGLLRERGFLAIIMASALIQGSHAAYYAFASITWQSQGLGGLTIAGLWAVGVLAEIVVFALSPRFAASAATLVMLGAASAVGRWVVTALEPPLEVLAVVQTMHGLTFGLTVLGTMGLLVRHVPSSIAASAQGYLAACSGMVSGCASILSGMVYARYGQGVYAVMAVMAAAGGLVIWLARRRLASPSQIDQPQSTASGGETVLPS